MIKRLLAHLWLYKFLLDLLFHLGSIIDYINAEEMNAFPYYYRWPMGYVSAAKAENPWYGINVILVRLYILFVFHNINSWLSCIGVSYMLIQWYPICDTIIHNNLGGDEYI